MIVVEPLMPASDAMDVLFTLAAVNACAPVGLIPVMLTELVTDPVGPVVPCVLTVIGPELKRLAGPYCTLPVGAVAVIGMAEPPGGSVTVGVGPIGGWGEPKRVTLLA